MVPGPQPVRVRFERGASAQGMVVHADGRPADGYAFRASRAGGREAFTGAPDARGAFELGGLGAGRWELAVATSDGRAGHLTLTLGPGERRRDGWKYRMPRAGLRGRHRGAVAARAFGRNLRMGDPH